MATRILALASVIFFAGCAQRCGESMRHTNSCSTETRTVSYAEEVPVYTARTDDCGHASTVALHTGDCGHASGDCGHISTVATRTGDISAVSTVAYVEPVETSEPIETFSNPDRRIEVTEGSEPANVSDSSSAELDRDFARERDANDRDSDDDRDFAKEAALANLAEIELGRDAVKNAGSEDVRKFAQRMIDDHTKAQSDLKAAAGSSFDLPTELDAEHRRLVEKHSRLSGKEFDRAYLDMMVDNHSQVIGKFERASESAKDKNIREFAGKTLPVLREHLSQARDTQSRLRPDSLKRY